MNSGKNRTLCLVISAPSGGGKTTLCRMLIAEFPSIAYSISYTTRKMRQGEVPGKSYVFLEQEEFLRLAEAGEFLEYARVHDSWYGTRRHDVESALLAGRDVIMDIDFQGAENIRKLLSASPGKLLADAFVDIFIMPPSIDELEKRLRARSQDSEETILLRLKNARRELRESPKYKYTIINDDLDRAYRELKAIVAAERIRPGSSRSSRPEEVGGRL